MYQEENLERKILKIALPVTLQSLLQSSFGVIDQIMVGQLGSTSIAAIGLAQKYTSILNVLVSAIVTVAGIMISQYLGNGNKEEVNRSFIKNGVIAVCMALIFGGICLLIPDKIMGIYTKDKMTLHTSVIYLQIIAMMFLPMAVFHMLSVLFRCLERASLPLYASILSAVVNTALNYMLIFGHFGCKAMGVRGAAYASVIAQCVSCLFLVILGGVMFRKTDQSYKMIAESMRSMFAQKDRQQRLPGNRKQYLNILIPILICELLWSLGENVYAVIYGHMGTQQCAAMTLTSPIQALLIGALSGIAQASGIIIGKELGRRGYDKAYRDSKKILCYGLIGALMLSGVLLLAGKYYVLLYSVEAEVRMTARHILIAFAIVLPIKVQNMILGGGIVRSGGETKYIMYVDFIGTWLVGVPVGMIAAFACKLSIPYVYFLLSQEELVRFLITLVIFKKKKWMKSLAKI